MLTKRFRRRVERGERGAALVEFALVFPVFMTLVLGMFSGGMAYNRKNTLINAAREGARYGATLAPGSLGTTPPSWPPECYVAGPEPSSPCGIDTWVEEVADAVEQNAEGDLRDGVEGRMICVAYLWPAGDANSAVPHGEKSHKLTRPATGPDTAVSAGTTTTITPCFADGRPTTEKRVQVRVTRRSEINLLFFDIPVTLTAESVTRFEATEY